MAVRIVADPDELALAGYRDLVGGEGRRRADRAPETFVVEGHRAIEQLIERGWPLRSVLLSARRASNRPGLVTAAERSGAEVFVATQEVFDRIAGYPVHRGALALAERPAAPPPADVVRGAGLVLVVEGVNDLENLGSLFRNAAAFGVGALLLDPSTADPLYRRAVRVSLGHVTRIPFARVDAWPGGLSVLTDAGLTVVALTPTGAETIDDLVASGPGAGRTGWAVMVGSEGDGLGAEALAIADRVVRIPMAAGVDSVNVATAAAIAFHRLAPGGA